MHTVQFIRLVVRHRKVIFGLPIFMAMVTFYFTMDQVKKYTSHTLINTGLVSGYNPESQKSSRTDYTYTTNELENLINIATAYNTFEELGARLLSEYLLLNDNDPRLISGEGYKKLQQLFPDNIKSRLVGNNLEDTYQKVIQFRDQNKDNGAYKVLYSDHEFFGIEQLQTIKVQREGKSDMIRITYTSNDPGISKRSLELLTEIFVKKHQEIKEGQSTSVLDFFDKSTSLASEKLKDAENGLLQFRVGNNIINYYEQTRFISAKKEDLDELYQSELMKVAATESSIKQLENQMVSRKKIAQLNSGILHNREQLSNATSQLAKLIIINEDVETNRERIASLEKETVFLKNEIKTKAHSIFSNQITPDGIEIKNVLNRWLTHVIALDEGKARLQVINERKDEFAQIYNQFAPLGSRLKKIEREIDVAEREYLENLHSLNQARLHKHSMLMSTNLKIVDQPFFPAKAVKSKRAILIIISFVSGILLILFLILVLEYFDQTLKLPSKAEDITGLEVIGAFPYFSQTYNLSRANLNEIKQRTIEYLYQNLKIKLKQRGKTNKPLIINIASTRETEGKTFLGENLFEFITGLNKKALLLKPKSEDDVKNENSNGENIIDYLVDKNFMEADSVNNLLRDHEIDINEFDFVLIESPALNLQKQSLSLLSKSDLTLVVCRANRVWNSGDQKTVENLKRGTGKNPLLVLNACNMEVLEEVMGEIPKTRSKLRMLVKQFASFGFRSKLNLS